MSLQKKTAFSLELPSFYLYQGKRDRRIGFAFIYI